MVLGVLVALSASGCWIRNFDAAKRPDLVLITVDTLRADHLELHGHPRPTSPSITKLGRAGIVFNRAVAQAPWTLPSMASIHTGQPPSVHGAIDSETPIGSEYPTVAERLGAAGYHTQAVVSHVFVGSAYGFARGFEVFDESLIQGHDGSSSQALTEAALARFAEAGDAPGFLWVHYFDPHYSYERHPEYDLANGPPGRFGDKIAFASPQGTELMDVSRAEQQYMSDVYDEEIAHTDHWIGRLVEGVLEADRGRPAIFVVTADHGEAFLEHGKLAHGRDLYDELIRVPLIIGGDVDRTMRGMVSGRSVETAAVATTLLRLAGTDDNPFPGIDLIDTALSKRIPSFAFSEGSYARGRDGRKVSVEQQHWKLIHHLDDDVFELYNRQRDPEERDNLVDDPKNRPKRQLLMQALGPRSAAVRALPRERVQPRAETSSDERKKLRALGYLDEGSLDEGSLDESSLGDGAGSASGTEEIDTSR
ncbi:MAG: sulfatase-like hydrolase/transferase [bacterium]|nr:sulfatase-like hydrolase/transferase [bacterium]